MHLITPAASPAAAAAARVRALEEKLPERERGLRRYLPPGGELPSKSIGQVRCGGAAARRMREGCIYSWGTLPHAFPVVAFFACSVVVQGTLLSRVDALERAMDTLLRAQVSKRCGGWDRQWRRPHPLTIHADLTPHPPSLQDTALDQQRHQRARANGSEAPRSSGCCSGCSIM